MAALMPQGKQQFFTAGGIPLVGGKVYTYAAGTTTPLATYTTAAASTPNTNPVILDSRGEASIFFSAANYKIVVKDSLDSTIWTQDNLAGDAAATIVANLAASTGSSLVGHIASGTGAVATTVQSKLRERVTAFDMLSAAQKADALAGTFTLDCTSAIQAVIDAAPTGAVIDGLGASYLVTTLKPKSYCTLENFFLKTKAGTGPTADFVSPITINYGQTSALFTDITIRNVHINGNRVNQLSIDYPTPAGEDGGRHGFRILGHVKNLLIEDCSATYCGTDGIEFLSIAAYPTNPSFVNIKVVRSNFNWNRRHGGSHPSADNIKFIDCEFNDNGQTLAGGPYPAYDGGRGANIAGVLYGNGYDMEQGGAGGHSANVYWDGCQMLRNAESGLLGYDPSVQTNPAFVANTNINITNCKISKGTVGATNYAIILTSSIAQTAGGAVYKQVNFVNNNLTGRILLRACAIVTLDEGVLVSTGSDIGQLDYATNVIVGTTQTAGQVFANTASTVAYVATPAQGTWTPSVTSYTGTLTTVSAATGYYTKVGNLVFITGTFTITDNGTGAILLQVGGLPFTGALLPANIAGCGLDRSNAKSLTVEYDRGSSNIGIRNYDATYPGVSGHIYTFSLTYSV